MVGGRGEAGRQGAVTDGGKGCYRRGVDIVRPGLEWVCFCAFDVDAPWPEEQKPRILCHRENESPCSMGIIWLRFVKSLIDGNMASDARSGFVFAVSSLRTLACEPGQTVPILNQQFSSLRPSDEDLIQALSPARLRGLHHRTVDGAG